MAVAASSNFLLSRPAISRASLLHGRRVLPAVSSNWIGRGCSLPRIDSRALRISDKFRSDSTLGSPLEFRLLRNSEGWRNHKKLKVMASANEESAASVTARVLKRTVIFAVPVLITTLFFNGTLFGYHPSLLSFGYLFFMGEGILASIKAKGKQRQLYMNIHYVFQVLAFLSIAAGTFAIYRNKNLLGKSHLLTLHARLGALTLLSSLLVFLGGLPVFYGLPKSLKKLTAKVNRGHKLFGAVAFFGALITSLFGLQVFSPNHPLHKGIPTYIASAGIVLIGFVILSSTFAVSEIKKLSIQEKKTS